MSDKDIDIFNYTAIGILEELGIHTPTQQQINIVEKYLIAQHPYAGSAHIVGEQGIR